MSIVSTDSTLSHRHPKAPSRLHVVRPSTSLPCTPPAGTATVPRTVADGLPVPTLTGTVDYANFDHAASTPALVSVKAAVDAALRT